MVLRRVFGPRRDEVTGDWRRLHNEELNDLYSTPIIVRVIISRIMRWVGHVAPKGEETGVYRVLVGKPEGRRTLGRPRCRWVDNIRTGEWRRMHNEELNDLYCTPNIVWVIKWRRIRWAGHVECMGEERGCIGSWWGNRRERDPWGDLGVDGWIILEHGNGEECITRS